MAYHSENVLTRHSRTSITSLVVAAQLALLGVFVVLVLELNELAFSHPWIDTLRLVIVFLHFTLVPGFVIVHLVGFDDPGPLEAGIYSVGFSLLFLMAMGLVIHAVPLIGFRPVPILGAVWVGTMGLILLALRTDRHAGVVDWRTNWTRLMSLFHETNRRQKGAIALSTLALGLAVVGANLAAESNHLLLVMLPLVGLVVLLLSLDKSTPPWVHATVIFLLSLALLYHRSLVSPYLWGWDIHREYYFANLVVQHGQWFSSLSDTYNAMLSIVFLGPMYSLGLNIGLTMVFKAVYPVLYSMMPVSLYLCYRNQIPERPAFIAAFFFIAFFGYYSLMPQLVRQQIAELFLALLLVTVATDSVSERKRAALIVVFYTGCVVSHYGTTIILTLTLIVAHVFYVGLKTLRGNVSYFTRVDVLSFSRWSFSSGILAASLSIMIAWFGFAAGGQILRIYIQVISGIFGALVQQVFSPQSTAGAEQLAQQTTSPLRTVEKVLHIVTMGMATLGLLWVALRNQFPTRMRRRFGPTRLTIGDDLFVLAGIFFGLAVAGLTVPGISGALNTNRFYQLLLVLLSPMSVIGFIVVLRLPDRVTEWPRLPSSLSVRVSVKRAFFVIGIFFTIFLLFNSWWVYQIAHSPPGSISLGQEMNEQSENIRVQSSLYGRLNTNQEDVAAVTWLRSELDAGDAVYADYFAHHAVMSYGGVHPRVSYERSGRTMQILHQTPQDIPRGSYVFVGHANTEGNLFRGGDNTSQFNRTIRYRDAWISDPRPSLNRVYTTGNASIYQAT